MLDTTNETAIQNGGDSQDMKQVRVDMENLSLSNVNLGQMRLDVANRRSNF
jgi:hypothetical protein